MPHASIGLYSDMFKLLALGQEAFLVSEGKVDGAGTLAIMQLTCFIALEK